MRNRVLTTERTVKRRILGETKRHSCRFQGARWIVPLHSWNCRLSLDLRKAALKNTYLRQTTLCCVLGQHLDSPSCAYLLRSALASSCLLLLFSCLLLPLSA